MSISPLQLVNLEGEFLPKLDAIEFDFCLFVVFTTNVKVDQIHWKTDVKYLMSKVL